MVVLIFQKRAFDLHVIHVAHGCISGSEGHTYAVLDSLAQVRGVWSRQRVTTGPEDCCWPLQRQGQPPPRATEGRATGLSPSSSTTVHVPDIDVRAEAERLSGSMSALSPTICVVVLTMPVTVTDPDRVSLAVMAAGRNLIGVYDSGCGMAELSEKSRVFPAMCRESLWRNVLHCCCMTLLSNRRQAVQRAVREIIKISYVQNLLYQHTNTNRCLEI